VAEAVRPAAAGREEPRPRKLAAPAPFAGRFLVAYAVVLLTFGAGLGLIAYFAWAKDESSPAWSTWKPSASDFKGAREIAAYVTKRYKVSAEGKQVVFVQPSRAEVNGQRIVGIGVPETVAGTPRGDFKYEFPDNLVLYDLCGVGGGGRCALPQGVQARDPIFRRQALELALYSLKYLDVDAVVTFLPPPSQTTNWALYFKRSDLTKELSRPLSRTIAPAAPPRLGVRDDQTPLHEVLTYPHWFNSELQQTPVGSLVLRLGPPVINPLLPAGFATGGQ
jgi:hypothetical protein